ncbi:MAG: ribonuclease P protein component [Candidatus Bruticola sp.]
MITLTRSKDFDRIFRHGSSVSSSEVVIYALKRSKGKFSQPRAAFCVSKKFGKAVARNRVKRRLREVYRLNEGKLDTQWDVILLARQGAAVVQFAQLEKKFLSLCRRAGILKEVPRIPETASP